MPLVQTLLYYIPNLLLGTIIVGLSVAFSVGGLFLIRRFIPIHKLKLHNDVAGIIFTTLGVIYAVLLAFMVVVSWQNYDKSSVNVANEANCIESLYRDAAGLGPVYRDQIRSALNVYAIEIIEDEWPLLKKGGRSQKVQDASEKLWSLYTSYQPVNKNQDIFLAESVQKLNKAAELRRQRIIDANTGIHSVLWFVLVIGGMITILFTLFFGTENFGAQLIMTSMLSMLIGLILFTIMGMDYPFTGNVSIQPVVFRQLLIHFKL